MIFWSVLIFAFAGAILGGTEVGRIFIENSRHHAALIANSIERRLRHGELRAHSWIERDVAAVAIGLERDRAVGVTVVVAEDDRGGLLRRQLRERCREVTVLDEHLRVGRESWPADASNDFADLAEAHLPLVRDGRVDRDAVQPRLGQPLRIFLEVRKARVACRCAKDVSRAGDELVSSFCDHRVAERQHPFAFALVLVPAGTRCPACGGADFRKETDILDVWVDSGCSHAAVLETRPDLRWPADMYLEGSDQHRGWFHSSLLESVGTRGRPPYKSVLTHGFLVDGEGRKLSKSVGNYVTQEEILPKYGAEVMRLWVAAEDYTEDIRLSEEILVRLGDAYRRIRNTFRFLLGTLADFDPERDRVSYGQMDEIDRWALLRLGEMIARVRRAYDEYQFHVVFHTAHNFCAVDLSSLYLDIIKDRLYTSAPDDPRRRASQTVCFELLTALTRLMAPVLTFTADEVWSYIPGRGKPESVHLVLFPEERGEWTNERLAADWERLLEVRGEVSRALEVARQRGRIGKGVDAVVHVVSAPEEEWRPLLERKGEALLTTLFNVSGVRLKQPATGGEAISYESQDIPGLTIEIVPAQSLGWKKCERCWTWSPRVGEDAEHPTLCER